MVWIEHDYEDIPGTYVFNGERAHKGYPLNKMCFSLNDGANRKALKADPDAYCRQYGLSEAQREAVKSLDFLAMLRLGGNIYYLAKLAGAYGWNVQDVGAQMTGLPVDEFKARLARAAEQNHG